MKFDNIEVEFLEDGRIKILTDPISQPNHTNADKFIQQIARLMGGEVVYEKRTDSHRHGGQTHTHEHDGQKHEH